MVNLRKLSNEVEKDDGIYVDLVSIKGEEYSLVGEVLGVQTEPLRIDIDLQSVPIWLNDRIDAEVGRYTRLRDAGGPVRPDIWITNDGWRTLREWDVESITLE